MELRRDVFQAIADPTRRAIIDMLSAESLNLNAVAEQFDVSRPAISKHIKILHECGLIKISSKGRERYCRADLRKLREVSDWTNNYRSFWMGRMTALDKVLKDTPVKTKKKR